MSPTGRIAYFALMPILDSEHINYPYPLNFFLNTVPSFFFFTGFLIVLFLWYEFQCLPEHLERVAENFVARVMNP